MVQRDGLAKCSLGTGNWFIPGNVLLLLLLLWLLNVDHACRNNKLSYMCFTSWHPEVHVWGKG